MGMMFVECEERKENSEAVAVESRGCRSSPLPSCVDRDAFPRAAIDGVLALGECPSVPFNE